MPSSELCPNESADKFAADEDINCEVVTAFEVVAFAVVLSK